MTREQLDAIRKNVDFNDVSIHDVIPLLAEVERLTTDMSSLESIIDGLERRLDGPNGFRARAEKAEAEVERLTAERAALQVGDTESTTLEANERFAPSENVVVYIERWCDGSGPCAVELEPHGHWRLSRSVSLASVRKAERDAAFTRGVAAMREAAIEACRPEYPDAVRRLRALPDPEDK